MHACSTHKMAAQQQCALIFRHMAGAVRDKEGGAKWRLLTLAAPPLAKAVGTPGRVTPAPKLLVTLAPPTGSCHSRSQISRAYRQHGTYPHSYQACFTHSSIGKRSVLFWCMATEVHVAYPECA